MEHEIEKKLREKILLAEQQPVRWSKDEVWNKLNSGKLSRKRPVAFYYAAASVCLLATAIVFMLQRRYENNTNLTLKSLELSIERLRIAELPSSTTVEPEMDESACPEITYGENIEQPVASQQIRVSAAVTKRKALPTTARPPEDIPVTLAEITDESTLVTLEPIETSIQNEPPQLRTLVTTIIVEAPEQPETKVPTVVRKRKLRFNFLRPDKNGAESENKSQDSEILVARIN